MNTEHTPECAPACASLLRPLDRYPAQHAEGCIHYRNPGRRGDLCNCGQALCGECMARHYTGWRKWDRP